MKLIFNANDKLWIISKNELHQDVDGCTSLIVDNSFNPIASQNEGSVVYKTLSEVQAELKL